MKYIIAFLLFITLSACQQLGEVVVMNNTSVFYKEVGLRSIAEQTANYLNKKKFTQGTINAIQISRDTMYNVRVAMSKELAMNQGLNSNFEVLGTSISDEVFDGSELNFQLCDYRFNTIRTIPINHSKL